MRRVATAALRDRQAPREALGRPAAQGRRARAGQRGSPARREPRVRPGVPGRQEPRVRVAAPGERAARPDPRVQEPREWAEVAGGPARAVKPEREPMAAPPMAGSGRCGP